MTESKKEQGSGEKISEFEAAWFGFSDRERLEALHKIRTNLPHWPNSLGVALAWSDRIKTVKLIGRLLYIGDCVQNERGLWQVALPILALPPENMIAGEFLSGFTFTDKLNVGRDYFYIHGKESEIDSDKKEQTVILKDLTEATAFASHGNVIVVSHGLLINRIQCAVRAGDDSGEEETVCQNTIDEGQPHRFILFQLVFFFIC